jgi:hypothetical protein
MRYLKPPADRKHKLRPTALHGTRGTCSTTRSVFGQAANVCGSPVTLLKLWPVVSTLSSRAQADHQRRTLRRCWTRTVLSVRGVGVPPLVWPDELAGVAQEWTNHLIAAGGLCHRPNNCCGENVYT